MHLPRSSVPRCPIWRTYCQIPRRVAVLEDVTNYTNIGAVFRSAAALGIDAVLIRFERNFHWAF